jgi:hypothetical protein
MSTRTDETTYRALGKLSAPEKGPTVRKRQKLEKWRLRKKGANWRRLSKLNDKKFRSDFALIAPTGDVKGIECHVRGKHQFI